MFEGSLETFLKYFLLPNVDLSFFLLSILFVLIYTAICLLPFRPPLHKNTGLWIVLVAGLILTPFCIAFIQMPIQRAISNAISGLASSLGNVTAYAISGIFIALIASFVQQGARLIPTWAYLVKTKTLTSPLNGLIVGAVAGAGFGIIDAFLGHNQIFQLGLNKLMQSGGGIIALVVFERFFTLAMCTATTAIAGYGIATGKGWQYYLIICGVQFIFNYIPFLISTKYLDLIAAETLMFLIAAGTMTFALWLRYKKTKTG